MSINVSTFKTIKEQFPEWLSLKAHLESDAGGKLRVAEQGGLAVVRYDKNSQETTAQFRSVVWDVSANLPVCVAPFRANEGMPPMGVQFTAVEDFADGCMVNAWVSGSGLQISTRTRVGGGNKFYSDKTFGQLFDECLATTPLKTRDALKDCLEGLRTDVAGVSAFASFVLQHPEHRVVAKFASPGLHVVHTGYTLADGTVHISERAVNWPQSLARLQVSNYPPKNFGAESEVDDLLRNTAAQRGWRWQGLVFKDGTGARWRVRTPTYTMLRQLRGGEATPLERFFRLRAEHQVVDYLKHYGEDREAFWGYEQALRSRTADVLLAYTDVHKAHTVAFKDLPEALRPAVYLLHVMWRDELRPKGFSVRLQNAIAVVNKLRGFEKKRLMEAAPYAPAAVVEANAADDALGQLNTPETEFPPL